MTRWAFIQTATFILCSCNGYWTRSITSALNELLRSCSRSTWTKCQIIFMESQKVQLILLLLFFKTVYILFIVKISVFFIKHFFRVSLGRFFFSFNRNSSAWLVSDWVDSFSSTYRVSIVFNTRLLIRSSCSILDRTTLSKCSLKKTSFHYTMNIIFSEYQ